LNKHDSPLNLTKRQLECLTWSAAGKSSFEIGQILEISERGVNWHFTNAMKVLSSVSRIQAVARAVHLGLIKVEYLKGDNQD